MFNSKSLTFNNGDLSGFSIGANSGSSTIAASNVQCISVGVCADYTPNVATTISSNNYNFKKIVSGTTAKYGYYSFYCGNPTSPTAVKTNCNFFTGKGTSA